MKSRVQKILIPLPILLVISTHSVQAQDTTAEDQRKEFQSFYEQQKDSKSSFFSGAPSHHVTPKRDNISFALDVELVDVGIAPQIDVMPKDFSTLDNRLQMTGWSASPLVSFSAKNFGIGFTGEAGSRQIQYLYRVDETADSPASFYEQYSEMKYTGAGIYAFALLSSSALPNWLAGTLIVGGRSLTAIHETQGTRTDSTRIPEATKLKYDVNTLDFGINFAATLAKRFTVTPWANYQSTTLGKIKDRNENSAASVLSEETLTAVEQDRSLTWLARPALSYGIDFAVEILQFDVHFGGVLGYLANLNRGADRVHDKSVKVAVSYDIKSH